jgi:hypothetical protein
MRSRAFVDVPLPELRAEWHALATEPLSLLPREAIEASVRQLACELLARTDDHRRRERATPMKGNSP